MEPKPPRARVPIPFKLNRYHCYYNHSLLRSRLGIVPKIGTSVPSTKRVAGHNPYMGEGWHNGSGRFCTLELVPEAYYVQYHTTLVTRVLTSGNPFLSPYLYIGQIWWVWLLEYYHLIRCP